MKRLGLFLVAIVLAFVVGQPPALQAQEPPRPFRLDLNASPAPPVAVPVPSPQILEKDVDEATAIVKSREKAAEVTREVLQGPARQPNLNHDVVQGIQDIGIRDARRRR